MTAFLAMLLSLANAPYTTALLVVALYVGFQVVGLLPWGEHGEADAGHDGDLHADAAHDADLHADADGDADVDADADGDADVDADADGDADHDLDHSAENDADGHAEHGSAGSHGIGLSGALLGFLGVGRVPLAVIWQTLFTMFGLMGISATTLIGSITGHLRPAYLALTLPFASVTSVMLSAGVVRLVARLVPASSGEATRRRDLVGCAGVVISSQVTEEFGEIRLIDPQGRSLRVICRLLSGEPVLSEGTPVAVVDYDREKDQLYVSALERRLEGKAP